MKIICLLFVWILSASFTTDNSSIAATGLESQKVYYCTGPKAKRYHKYKTCKGLNKCSGDIRSCTVDEAKRKYLTECHICYKH